MSEEWNHHNLVSEHREHSEQPFSDKDSDCSLVDNTTSTTENKIPIDLNKHMQIIPSKSVEHNNIKVGYVCHESDFEIEGTKYKPGLYLHHPIENGGKPGQQTVWISTPLRLKATTASADQQFHGCLISVLDGLGNWHDWAMPMSLLNDGGTTLRSELLNLGLRYEPKQKSHIVDYLMRLSNQDALPHIIAVKTIGWHGKCYVLPHQIVGEADIIYQSTDGHCADFTSKGTLKDWDDTIGQFCLDNPTLQLSVCVALGGPLLDLVNIDLGTAVHFIGDSSSGKSTSLEVANSVWGPPESTRSWRSTANGLEAVISSRNDNLLILDEIDEACATDIGKIVYMLSNGKGKQRANISGGARLPKRWRTVTLSAGERSLASILQESGKDTNAGQEVRLLNIQADFSYGVFRNLYHFNDGREFSNSLKDARTRCYGTLGPAFIIKLIELREAGIDFKELRSQYSKLILPDANAHPIHKRAADNFALFAMAGEIASGQKLVSWTQGSSTECAKEMFDRWRDNHALDQTEDMKIIKSVRDYVSEFGDARFSNLSNPALDDDSLNVTSDRIHHRSGWYKIMNGTRVYLFHSKGLQMAAPRFDIKRISKALKKAGYIQDSDYGRIAKNTRTPSGLQLLYYVQLPHEEGNFT